MESRLDRVTRVAIPLFVALVGAFFFHRYSILTGLDRVEADPGDSRFIAFLLEHWNNVAHGVEDWRSPPIFWPVQGTLAYSDALVGMGAIHAALRPFLGVFAAMNLQLIFMSLASFTAAYLLMIRGFSVGVWGASFGAYFFAFSWPRFAQLVHVQLQFTPLLPLLALLALECMRDGQRLSRKQFGWRACLFVACLALLLATTLYYAIFIALALTVALLLLMLSDAARRHLAGLVRRQVAGLVIAAALAVLLVGPVIEFYLPLMRESQGRAWPEVLPSLPRPIEFLWLGRENLMWGWLFGRWPQALIDARWPEMRIGIGLFASVVWAVGVLWALWTLAGSGRRDPVRSPVAVSVVVGFVLQLLMMKLPGDYSIWWLVWKYFPGARGIRAVSRLEIVATLAMSIWFGFLLDRMLRRKYAIRAGAALLAMVVVVEQAGSVVSYSGSSAETMSRRVAAAIPASCRASYVVASPDLVTQPLNIDKAHFDSKAYLAANPDVAASWHASAWEHYQRFGRAEHRQMTPQQAHVRHFLIFVAYNYTVPLAAVLARRAVVNGLSGWQPPNWNLFDVLDPAAPQHLTEWLRLNHLPPDAACLVPVHLTIDMVPQFPARFWP